MLIDKPSGWTSHDAIAVVRRRLGLRAVGHTGTLDPFATGLLVVLIGRATRLARFIEASSKRYHATIRLGIGTDTEDGTGQVIAESIPAVWPTRHQVEDALASFVGTTLQQPPIYSAKHVEGERSYRLARTGREVALPPVEVTIDSLAIESFDPPVLTIDAVVQKGTYIRSLARDLGTKLGIPAHCAELRRVAVGTFDVAQAVAPEEVGPEAILSSATMLGHLPQVVIDEPAVREISFGRTIPRAEGGEYEGTVALVAADHRLVAVAELRESVWQPVVVLEGAA